MPRDYVESEFRIFGGIPVVCRGIAGTSGKISGGPITFDELKARFQKFSDPPFLRLDSDVPYRSGNRVATSNVATDPTNIPPGER